jgi:hypothetical protein
VVKLSQHARDERALQLADDLWFIEKAFARGEINAREFAELQKEAHEKEAT